MAANLGNMVIHLGLDSKGMTSGTTAANTALGNLKTNVSATSGQGGLLTGMLSQLGITGAAASAGLASLAATLAAVAAAAAAIGGYIAGAAWGVSLAAQAEQASVSFKVLLGSAEHAQLMIEKLRDFAASTPFEFPEVRSAAQKLIAFGVHASDIETTLTRVGDVASGVGMSLNELAEIYGKAKVQGTLFAEDINQLTGRGIPIIQEFAKQMGVSESQVKKLASQGKITFANLEEAFKSLTSEGGTFGGMMSEQSQTLTGIMSTLWDQIQGVAAQFGQALLPAVKIVVDALGRMAEALGMGVETAGPMATRRLWTARPGAPHCAGCRSTPWPSWA